MIQSTTNFNTIYHQMFLDIQNFGKWSKGNIRAKYADGTPAHSKALIGYNFRFDNSTDIVPLIGSRFVPTKSAIAELYWIWILQSNKVQDLRDLGCKYWNEWEKMDGTIGKAYGYQIAKQTCGHPSQLHYILHEIKNNPNSRRIETEIWIPEELHEMSLTPCVHLTQWSVVDGVLHLDVRQRSCDFALGLVSNVFQYSILHRLVALECGLETGDLIWNIHNLHYYDRHEETLVKQFDDFYSRDYASDLPRIKIWKGLKSIWDFHPNKEHYELPYLNQEPKLKFEIAI